QEREASSENGEINDGHDSQPEQKCVSLKVADLKQTQKRADAERAAACSPDNPGINDPAVEESSDARQKFLSSVDQPIVKFVEVKTAPDKIDMQWVALTVAIEPNGDGDT